MNRYDVAKKAGEYFEAKGVKVSVSIYCNEVKIFAKEADKERAWDIHWKKGQYSNTVKGERGYGPDSGWDFERGVKYENCPWEAEEHEARNACENP